MGMLRELNENKIREEKINGAVDAMADAMITVPGITVPEMTSAALRIAARVVKQALDMSADGARARNEAVIQGILRTMLMDTVGNRSTRQ